VWEVIWTELYAALRERLVRQGSPTAAVLDSQTLKSAERPGKPGSYFRNGAMAGYRGEWVNWLDIDRCAVLLAC
jgi:hypothetical protein